MEYPCFGPYIMVTKCHRNVTKVKINICAWCVRIINTEYVQNVNSVYDTTASMSWTNRLQTVCHNENIAPAKNIYRWN